jgi:hypothetical protein
VSELIHSHINYLDEVQATSHTHENIPEENKAEDNDGQPFFGHIYLGSLQRTTTFEQVEQLDHSNGAFRRFRARLTTFVKGFAAANNIPLPIKEGRIWQKVEPTDEVNLVPSFLFDGLNRLVSTAAGIPVPQSQL